MTTTKYKNYNEEYVRTAAYYNWKNAGCPCGNDEYFWNMAINQLYGTCCGTSSTSSSSCSTKSSTSKCSSSTTSKTTSSKKTK